jgi:hypothetical protein
VIYNSLSIHSQCFKGNENEENFWFDDPWNASMEEAVPATDAEDEHGEEEDGPRTKGEILGKMQEDLFVRMEDILKTKIRCVVKMKLRNMRI